MPEIESAHEFYGNTLDLLSEAKVPFLVGGAFAQEYFTGISRDTKDLDLFMLEEDVERACDVLERAGYHTETTFSHWLSKAYAKDGVEFVDIIFNSGNGLCKVDPAWFDHAPTGQVFGRSVRYCPVEESIWQKAFIMERERFDGADIAHLLRAQSENIDWRRLLARFGAHWRVLLAYVILFGYIYPTERNTIPSTVQHYLTGLFAQEVGVNAPGEAVCAGTLLSRAQYLVDIQQWGYRDIRTPDLISPEALDHWTAAVDK
jgi:hypothetical protein